MIDVNDLRLFKANEFKLDSYYYIKQDDGSFATAIVRSKEEWNKWSERFKQMFREGMKKMSEENRLYVRINRPWASFI